MRSQKWLFVAASVLAGTGGAFAASPRPTHAQPTCEFNACRLSTGNCDVTDLWYNCKEIGGSPGCESNSCSME
jgi:hypothetical protein